MGLFRISLFSAAVLLPLLVAGCGSVQHDRGQPASDGEHLRQSHVDQPRRQRHAYRFRNNATQVTVTGSNDSSYTIDASGGTQKVSPAATTTYTVTAVGAGGTATAKTVVTVNSAILLLPLLPSRRIRPPSHPAARPLSPSRRPTLRKSRSPEAMAAPTRFLQPAERKRSARRRPPLTRPRPPAPAAAPRTALPLPSVLRLRPRPPWPSRPIQPASHAGSSSTLTVTATNATAVTVTGTDGSSYTLSPTGGTQKVSPSQTTTYTATATGAGGSAKATATVTVGIAGHRLHHRQTDHGCHRRLFHADGYGNQCHRGNGDRNRRQLLYAFANRRNAGCNPEANHHLHRDGHRRHRRRNRHRIGHCDSWRQRQSHPARRLHAAGEPHASTTTSACSMPTGTPTACSWAMTATTTTSMAWSIAPRGQIPALPPST